MYVEYQRPDPALAEQHATPVVMFPGGCVTGALYWSTPDERPGWAHHFVERGWTVYVVDWPGHGRSGFPLDLATMPYERVVEAGQKLLERIGPAVVLGGSMSGPIAWKLADLVPDKVRAILAWAPGPPGNIQPVDDPTMVTGALDESQPVIFTDQEYMRVRWAAGPLFPVEHLAQYQMLHVPESARTMNQRRNAGGTALYVTNPAVFASIPVLILTSENDRGHPREHDEAIARFLGADFAYLPEVGMPGHSHEMMLDHKNEELSAYMLAWLEQKGVR
jgi:pimeloyl-ACP methyl ester carboxylesterase